VGESNTIRIGNAGTTTAFMSGVFGVAMTINASSQLGTTLSSRRYKDKIVDAKKYDVSKLRVCNFVYKEDKTSTVSVGLIAEEVEEVLPELVMYKDDIPETVRYLDLIPILLQKVQEERIFRDKLCVQFEERCDKVDAQLKELMNKLCA
jgi:RNA processing factor Prp31